MITSLKALCEKYQTLLITTNDLDLIENDQLCIYQVKGNSSHRYNFALLKNIRKSIRESGINQIVICCDALPDQTSDLNLVVNFDFNMDTFFHGQQIDFITEEQYCKFTVEHLIIEQCLALLEAEDIQLLIRQRKLRLVGVHIQPNGYWKTIFINGFDVNHQRLLN